MRVGPDSLVLVVVLLASSVVLSHAEDAKPAPNTNPASGLFQSLSLGSNKGPVHIDADSLELDYKSSNVIYRGHVEVTQGDVTLNSDTLSISYDPQAVKQTDKPQTDNPKAGVEKTATSGTDAKAADPKGTDADRGKGPDADRIKEIIAEGNVRIRQGTKLAEGRRAVFDQAKQTFTLSEGAVLHDGPNQVAGERVIVFLKEERSVESGSNSRVKAVLYPGKEDAEKQKATALPIQAVDTPAGTARP
jgi:lipopolysaccharide export system protein LptA